MLAASEIFMIDPLACLSDRAVSPFAVLLLCYIVPAASTVLLVRLICAAHPLSAHLSNGQAWKFSETL